ncbi:hypothetical protein T10_1100 [Trichinella papuae]|uniref:Uncharacterized protein n=1 Tax=Trichinella papuae TaxID=268474 RepID=A0A0V1M2R3_9BILA|nr:hypothetical protein T10_1100 [Trichinella papuae]
MEVELVGRKRHWGTENVGGFCGESGTWRKNACKAVWGKAAPCQIKFCCFRFCAKETARGRKKSFMVDRVKASLVGKNESGVGEQKTALG